MSELSGKKADLDTEGIPFDLDGKADLDTEGISLGDSEPDPQRDSTQSGPSPFRQDLFSRRFLLIVLIILLVLLVASAGTVALVKGLSEKPTAAFDEILDPAPQTTFAQQEDVILDPFVILVDQKRENSTGVLIAQLSLQTEPDKASNVYGRIFELRSIIYRRLSDNASLYSKHELTEMLRRDFLDYSVRDVAFIRFDLH